MSRSTNLTRPNVRHFVDGRVRDTIEARRAREAAASRTPSRARQASRSRIRTEQRLPTTTSHRIETMATAGESAASANDEQRSDAEARTTAPAIENTPGESQRVTEQEEATIIEAWRSGKYPTKARCLRALGLERFNNAALWKRVKRAVDRTSRRSEKPT